MTMRTLFSRRRSLLTLAALALAACVEPSTFSPEAVSGLAKGGSGGSGGSGSTTTYPLAVNVIGLPSGAAANVVVSSKGFTATVTQTTVLQVKTGTYAVAVLEVAHNGVTYAGTALPSTVTVDRFAASKYPNTWVSYGVK